ncbi:MAG: ATP-binding protein [Methanothrix sp.]|nr:ATP-binding protein [Methanothrix sp.]
MSDVSRYQETFSPYQNDIQYLKDELQRLDLILEISVQRARCRADDPLRGMYVSDEEAASLLSNGRQEHPASGEEAGAWNERAEEALAGIETRLKKSLEAGFEPALQRMAKNLGLCRAETDIVVFSASFELDPKYRKIFGYLHDDLSRGRPSPGLIIESISTPRERMEMRRLFLPGSALMRHAVLTAADGRDLGLSTGLVLSPDVLEFIMGAGDRGGQERSALAEGLLLQETLPEEIYRKGLMLAEQLLEDGMEQGWICILQGARGSGRRALANLICSRLGRRPVIIDIDALDEEEAASRIKMSFSRAAIRSSPVLIEGYDALGEEAGKGRIRAALRRALHEFSGPVLLTSQIPVHFKGHLQARTTVIEIPAADYEVRSRIWQGLIGPESGDRIASEIAARFRLTPGRVLDAFASARSNAALEGRQNPGIDDVYRACRMESSRSLSSLARRIEPRRRLDEVVLPPDKMEQLWEIESHIKNRERVYVDWGFERKLSLGRGLNVLFSGSSGTGKTMAAEALASEIGLDLYKIDLSSVVSKYIGETEKNLRRIFEEAEESNAILFFDEADALFGKRSDVKDAHDRYANVEISYLLQKMEEHEGIVILATNLSRNMDEAFLRRMQFVVEFPFPEEDYRLQIWNTLLPAEAPVGDDLDIEFLAKKLKLAGGSIKNILVAAAFLAAEDSGVIGMKHLVKAAWKEMRKIGKICSPGDFGDYYQLVIDD